MANSEHITMTTLADGDLEGLSMWVNPQHVVAVRHDPKAEGHALVLLAAGSDLVALQVAQDAASVARALRGDTT